MAVSEGIMSIKVLTLIRGLPGSGKSHLARSMATQSWSEGGPWVHHWETDQFFVDKTTGEYRFNPEQIKSKHMECQTQVEKSMLNGTLHVVVSNTFSRRWEMQPYVELAVKYGYMIQEVTVKADFGNEHNVPQDVIDRMRARWEP